MTTSYPAKMEPVGDLSEADVDILNDPTAFAAECYSDLASDPLAGVLPKESRTAVTAFDAACDLVAETAAAGGDVRQALRHVSDTTYGMANSANLRGIELGIAFECFRQILIGALTPGMGGEQNNRSNLEAVERERAKLRAAAAAQAAD